MAKHINQIFVLILLINISIVANQLCLRQQAKIKSIVRAHYKNAFSQYKGALISSKILIGFVGGNNGSCLRDNIYTFNLYTESPIGYSIDLALIQKYEINTLKIWFWDGDNRYYNVKITILLDGEETQIYNNLARNILTITFPSQIVSELRILNIAGNTYNTQLHVIKVEAFYKLS
ncbi:unnamed protein product [Paramecium octaurelia]|uniref:Uncharacterized protein n=1 Tax=Paramecium octaurelia TaxID=43137 RepID=A0A8S1S200_PAROT|nr:unnamed protein product [Paramecium octaurelia]